MTAVPNEKPYTVADIEALPEGQRAELIDGDLYMFGAPLRIHQKISIELTTAIKNHIKESGKTCDVYAAPFAVYIGGADDLYNYVEPDISVICDKTKLTDKGCIGAPDWIIEIVSPSSIQKDYYHKLFLYRTAGVREYWIIDPDKQKVRTYLFGDFSTGDYSFEDSIPVGISDSLQIRISDLI
jgi:Uma2 family endonuclease